MIVRSKTIYFFYIDYNFDENPMAVIWISIKDGARMWDGTPLKVGQLGVRLLNTQRILLIRRII